MNVPRHSTLSNTYGSGLETKPSRSRQAQFDSACASIEPDQERRPFFGAIPSDSLLSGVSIREQSTLKARKSAEHGYEPEKTPAKDRQETKTYQRAEQEKERVSE